MTIPSSFFLLHSSFCIGKEWLLTAERVAVHLPTRTAVAADLHLGYAEARRRRGEAVPIECVTELLEPLRRVMRQHALSNLIIAGDLLEDSDCRDALTAFLDWLEESELDQIAVVPGNHDRGLELPAAARSRLILHPEGLRLGAWQIVHGEGALPDGPVVHGHDHPWLRWSPKSSDPAASARAGSLPSPSTRLAF